MILTKCKVQNIDIDLEINNKLQSGKLNELLLIVPTNRKIRSLKKEIISFSPGKAAGKLNLDTIGTFSSNLLFIKKGTAPDLLSDPASTVLLRQCFQESVLNYFSYYKKEIPYGTLNRIRNVISEYKRQGINPFQLREESKILTGSEKIKAADISLIYEKYLEKCKRLNVYEIGDVYRDLNELKNSEFEESFRELYPDVNLIIIMGFDELTSPEIEIINSAADVSNVRLYLSFDYYRFNPQVFSHLDKCYDKLTGKGFLQIEDNSPGEKDKFETILRKNLFHSLNGEKRKSYQKQVIKISALNRSKEIELIAKEIKELIKNKVEPNKICIAFNLIGKYSPLIRDVFPVYGIPFNLTDRFSLQTSQPVISIINFLEILENDFYYKNIFRALNSGFVKFKGINLSKLLKVSVNLKIIAGYDNWKMRLQDILRQLELPGSNNSSRFLDREIYARALADIELLSNLLAPFRKKMTLKEFGNNLHEIIFSLDIPPAIINSSSFEIEENIKAVTTFTDTVNELLELLELEYGGNAGFSLKFYLNSLRTAVTATRYNIKERSGYGIQVTTLNEIRGLKFDYLFISGLTDGDFPTRFSPEIFYSGSYARSEFNHNIEERYLFYQSLCSWTKRLYLTCPAQEENRELSESNFLIEFSKIFETLEKNEKSYSDTIYSKEELLIELGKKGTDLSICYPEAIFEINPERIQKSIYINKLRAGDILNESEYTGFPLVNDNEMELKDKLEENREKQFSISQLETYAKCPYKYFVERILGLEIPDEPSEEIEAIEMGSLLHLILYDFYSALKSMKINLQYCKDEEFEAAGELIFNIAKARIDESGFHSGLSFYEKEKILGISGDRRNSLLYRFLLFERENNSSYTPEFFEKSFGIMDSSAPVIIKAGEIFVRGKIDRIDVNKEKKTFKVIDYKLSGKKPSSDQIHNAISLQLPLYMFAAKELIKQELNEEYSPAGAEIYSLKFSEKDFGKKSISLSNKKNLSEEDQKILNEAIIVVCVEAINNYVDRVSSGKFNLSSLKNRESVVCEYCDFKGICRIKEVS